MRGPDLLRDVPIRLDRAANLQVHPLFTFLLPYLSEILVSNTLRTTVSKSFAIFMSPRPTLLLPSQGRSAACYSPARVFTVSMTGPLTGDIFVPRMHDSSQCILARFCGCMHDIGDLKDVTVW